MKIINILFILVLFNNNSGFTQNLVPNPSFEDTIGGCPTSFTGMAYCKDWNSWDGSTSDYFIYCSSVPWSLASVPSNQAGYQVARSGKAYAGFITNKIDSFSTIQSDWNEYVMTQLKFPLIVGQLYELTFYLNLANKTGHTTSSYGVLLSTNSHRYNFNTQGYLNESPQLKNTPGNYLLDKTNWVEFKRRFIADSSYQHITIGNFLDRFQSPMVNVDNNLFSPPHDFPYFLIDDVSIFPIHTICQGDTIELNSLGNTLFSWATTFSPQTIFSNDSSIIVSPSSNTTYIDYSNGDTSYYYVEVLSNNSINFGNDTNLCVGQSLLLEAAISNSTYLWQDNSTDYKYEVSQPGTYWVHVTNGCGAFTDTINVTYNIIPVYLGNDTSICFGSIVVLDPGISNATYLWNTTNTNQQQQVNPSWGYINTYWVQVKDSNGCGIDTINISVVPYYAGNLLGKDTFLCETQHIELKANDLLVDTYLWSTGSTDSVIIVTTSGQYWLKTINKCYTYYDTVNVSLIPKPIYQLNNEINLCEGDTISLSVNSSQNIATWWNNFYLPIFKVHNEGTYHVKIHSQGCYYVDSINVIIINCEISITVPNVFTPNQDGVNDFFMVTIENVNDYNINIFNRWGQLVFESNDITNNWEGIFKEKDCSNGTYFYIINASNEFESKIFKGTLSLIR